MKNGGLLAVGVVGKPHGVRGKVRVTPLGDDPRQILALQDVLIGRHPDDLRVHRILRVQSNKGLLVMELEGFTLDRAVASVGSLLWVHRHQLPSLEEGEFYWSDLIGLHVEAEGEGRIGIVENVQGAGGHELLVCRVGQREVLIPFVEDWVLEVDLAGGRIVVRLSEGLP